LFKNGDDALATSGVYIANAANNRAYNFQQNADGSSLNLWAYGGSSWANRLTVQADGNVGIGTTSPSQKLEVAGVIKSTSTDAAHLILNGDSNNSGDTGQVDSIIDFLGDGDPGIYGYRINTENYSGQTALHFQEYLNGSYTSRLYISKNGDVGIGTTSPTNYSNFTTLAIGNSSQGGVLEFQYAGSQAARIAATGANTLQFVTNNSERIRITSGGNVGIGTTSPSQKLQVDGGATGLNQGIPATSGTSQNGILRLTSGASTYGETLDFGMNVGPTYGWIQATNKDGLNTNYNLSLNPNGGNVGIGTTNPERILHLDADQGRAIIQLDKGGDKIVSIGTGSSATGADDTILQLINEGVEKVRIFTEGNSWLNGGKVGIGTTNPDAKLHVTDSIRIDTGGAGPSAAPTTGTPTQAQVRTGGDETYYLSEPDTWLMVNIGGTDYVLPAYEA
jgi:hypothetical protein